MVSDTPYHLTTSPMLPEIPQASTAADYSSLACSLHEKNQATVIASSLTEDGKFPVALLLNVVFHSAPL